MLENEIFKFEENICDFEEDLNSQGSLISDEVNNIIFIIVVIIIVIIIVIIVVIYRSGTPSWW